MSAAITDFSTRRTIRDLNREMETMEAELERLRLAADPALRERIFMALILEQRERYAALIAHVRNPLVDLIETALAEQASSGDALDPLRALCLVLQDRRLMTVADRLPARIAALQPEYARLAAVHGRAVFRPPPARPCDPAPTALTEVPT